MSWGTRRCPMAPAAPATKIRITTPSAARTTVGGRLFRCRQLRRETRAACDTIGGCRLKFSARGSEMIFKALAAVSGGDLSLMERTLPPGGRQPPPHRHTNCSEAYFGLDGLVTVTVEGAERTLGREDFVLVPRGTGHTFGN